MSEIYSDVEEEVDDIEDEYEEEFEAIDEEVADNEEYEPMASPIASPVAAPPTTQSMATSNEYEDEYEQDEDEYQEEDEYEDEYEDDEDNNLKQPSVILGGEVESEEHFDSTPNIEQHSKTFVANNKENNEPVFTNVAKGPKNSQRLNVSTTAAAVSVSQPHVEKSQTESNFPIEHTKKSKVSKRRSKKHHDKNKEHIPSPEWEVKSEAMPSPEKKPLKSILKKSKEDTEEDKETSPKIHRAATIHPVPSTQKEKILKGAVDVALGILNGDPPQASTHELPQAKSSGRRRFAFKGTTPVTSKKARKSKSPPVLRPAPLHHHSSADGPRSNYTELLSEISERSARLRSARHAHSPSGFDLGGLNEARAEANVAAAWKQDAEWAYEAMRITEKAKRKSTKKKHRATAFWESREIMRTKEAFIEAYLKKAKETNKKDMATTQEVKEDNANEDDEGANLTGSVPVGVPGVREMKKQAFVYDLHGRRMTQEEFEEHKKQDEEQKKKSHEEDERDKAAKALLPKKSPPKRMLGVLTGNIKQAYEQYVKQRQQEKTKLEGIVNQLNSSRMNWIERRADDMYPDAGLGGVEVIEKPDYDTPVRWGLYEAISKGDVIITIEAKTSWRPGKSPYSRHNPATYKEMVKSLRHRILDRLQGRVGFRLAIEVCGGWGEAHPKKVKHIEGRVEPRLGSFEVQVAFINPQLDRLVVDILFSKLKSHHWPNVDRVVEKLCGHLSKNGLDVGPISPRGDASPTRSPIIQSNMTVQNGYHPKNVVWLFDNRPGAKQMMSSSPQPTVNTNTSLFGTALNTTSRAMTSDVSENREAEVVPIALPTELTDWLKTVDPHLKQYGSILNDAGFDSLVSLATITESDKECLDGIKPGHWKVLLEAVRLLRHDEEQDEKEAQLLLEKEEALKKAEEERLVAVAAAAAAEERAVALAAALAAREAEERAREEAAIIAAQKAEEEKAEAEAQEAEAKAKIAKLQREKAAAAKKAEEEAAELVAKTKAEEEAAASKIRSDELTARQAEAKHAAKKAKKAAKAAKKAKGAGGEGEEEAAAAAQIATEKAEALAMALKELSKKQAEEEEKLKAEKEKADEELKRIEEAKKMEEEAAKRIADQEEEEVRRKRQEAEAVHAKVKAAKLESEKKKAFEAKKKEDEEKKKIDDEKKKEEEINQVEKEKAAPVQSSPIKAQEQENSLYNSPVEQKEVRVDDNSVEKAHQEALEKAQQEEEEEARRFFEAEEEAARQDICRMPDSWVYIDNHGSTQGPFASSQMMQWVAFFKPETMIAPVFEGEECVFLELQVLYPDTAQAFIDPPHKPSPPDNKKSDDGKVDGDDDDGYGDDFEEEEPKPLIEKESEPSTKVEPLVEEDDGYGDDFEEEEVKEKVVEVAQKPTEELLSAEKKHKHKHTKKSAPAIVEKTETEEEYAGDEFEEHVEEEEEPKHKIPQEPVSLEAVKSGSDALHVGVKVEARYQKGADWFPGKVAKVHHNGKLDISYDDGDFETSVKPKYIRLIESEPIVEVELEPMAELELDPELEPEKSVKRKEKKSSRSKSRSRDSSSINTDTVHTQSQSVNELAPLVEPAPDVVYGDDIAKSFQATMNAMVSLRGMMKQSGLTTQTLFDQLLECGTKKSSSLDRNYLSLTDFRSGVKKYFRDAKTEPLIKTSAWEGEEASEEHSNAMLAFLDLKGTGQISLQCLDTFLSGKENLAYLWHRIRLGVNKSSKVTLDMLDSHLFTRYDKQREGVVSAEELKRALKHLKHIDPHIKSDELHELVRCFSSGSGGVNYLDFVSWLNPVRIDKSCKKAAKILRTLLNTIGVTSMSKANESDVVPLLDGKDSLNVSELAVLLNSGDGEEFSKVDTRAVLLHTSSTPQHLVIGPDGLLRMAQNSPFMASNSSSLHRKPTGSGSPNSLNGAPPLMASPNRTAGSFTQSELSLSGAPSLNNSQRLRSEFSGEDGSSDRPKSSRPKSASSRSSKSSKRR